MQRWGEPRQTRDVDLTLMTESGGEAPFVDELLAAYEPRVPEARDFALRSRVLLLETSSGVGLDVALGALPFERRAVRRATDWVVGPRVTLHTCSAEDLIVFKAFAGRSQDWSDISAAAAQIGALLRGGITE